MHLVQYDLGSLAAKDHRTSRHHPQYKGTLMQPVQGDLHRKVANTHLATHMAAQHGNIWQTSYSHSTAICNGTLQNIIEEPITGPNERSRNRRTDSCFLSPAPATLREKTQCFALRHPPQHKANTFLCHHFSKKSLLLVTTSQSDRFSKSSLLLVTICLSHPFSQKSLP